jgi:hypothetical protein
MRLNKYLAASTILCVSVGCSTVGYKKLNGTDLEMCVGGKAKQKYIFNLAAYSKLPSGISVAEAAEEGKNRSDFNEYIAKHFTQLVMARYFDPTTPLENGEPSVRNASLFNGEYFLRSSNVPYLSGVTWVNQNNFAVCAVPSECENLKYPNPKDSTPISFGRHDFLYSNYSAANTRESYPRDRGRQGLLDYLLDSGFGAGRFLETHYFDVPDRDKASVCAAAGLSASCYEFKNEDSFIAFRNQLQSGDDHTLRVKFPFLSVSEFKRQSLEILNSDPAAKLDWQSALSKDLFIMASTKTSKAIQGDWIIHRIEWDPTLFCKYGKSINDLVTH